jgi:hypothetical protein
MVFILRAQKLMKSLLVISRFNMLTEFGGVPKMHFGDLNMLFLPTAPIHIVCYIRFFF